MAWKSNTQILLCAHCMPYQSSDKETSSNVAVQWHATSSRDCCHLWRLFHLSKSRWPLKPFTKGSNWTCLRHKNICIRAQVPETILGTAEVSPYCEMKPIHWFASPNATKNHSYAQLGEGYGTNCTLFLQNFKKGWEAAKLSNEWQPLRKWLTRAAHVTCATQNRPKNTH